MKHRHNSIRRNLLIVLALTISLATLIQAAIAYRVALLEVDDISDYHMIQMAHAVRRGAPAPTHPLTQTNLIGREDRSFTVLVTPLATPEINTGQAESPGGERGFSTSKENNQNCRVFTLYTPDKKIEVMQDLSTRNLRASKLALSTILPILILAPLLLLFVWLGASRALHPLIASRDEIARRNINDLHALQTDDVPEELLPFIFEINVLFSRISSAFSAQQNFVAYAAHELRSPLAALRLQAQGLQRANPTEACTIATTRLIAGVDRATRLVEQMLVLAREETPGAQTCQTDLPTITRLALSDVLPLTKIRKTDIGASMPEGVPDHALGITGNVEALRTLLRNLLENAVKYAPEQGIVNLSIRRDAGQLVLCVEDNGPGVAVADRSVIFERFRRISDHNVAGSGLGLAIVKAIADRHHISIELGESEQLGGLAVSLRFPSPDTSIRS